MNTRELFKDITIGGGGTYWIRSFDNATKAFDFERSEHEFGYYIAREDAVKNLPELALTENLLYRVVYSRHYLSGLYLGVWKDERGNWTISESEWEPSTGFAIATAKLNKQHAIWNIEKGEAITL